jgi:DNA-binding response OmpR family regulator
MQSTPSALPSGPPGPPSQLPCVALCEPDPLLRELLWEWLRHAGLNPVRCVPPGDCKEVVLVVADVAAPRQGGAACIAILRHAFPHARVLAISAQFTPGLNGISPAAARLGADAVMAKPFAAEEFMGAVRALVAP